MAEYTIVHISDLHFGSLSSGLSDDGLRASFLTDLEERLSYSATPTFVAISGDVTWTGASHEFELAQQFINELMHRIGLPLSHLICVPGTHDVDRELQPKGHGLLSYEKFAQHLRSGHVEPAPSVVDIFEKEAIAFLRISTVTGRADEDALDEQWLRRIRVELRKTSISRGLLVAVLHHGFPNSSVQSEAAYQTELMQLFDEWGVNVVLHGHVHGPQSLVARQTDAAMQFHLGAGTTPSPFARMSEWRYWLIDVHDGGDLTLRSRSFVGDRLAWRDDRPEALRVSVSLLASQRPILSTAINVASVPPPNVSILADKLSQLSSQDFEEILRRMGSAPQLRRLSEFTSRWDLVHNLLREAERSGSLALLAQECERLSTRSDEATSRVFISYSFADRAVADRIATELVRLGYAAWLAGWEVNAGDRLSDKIARGMAGADVMMLLLSPNYIQSSYSTAELNLWESMHARKNILPIKIAECSVPTRLSSYMVADLTRQLSADSDEMAASLRRLLWGILAGQSNDLETSRSVAKSSESTSGGEGEVADQHSSGMAIKMDLFRSLEKLEQQGFLPAIDDIALFESVALSSLAVPYSELIPLSHDNEREDRDSVSGGLSFFDT